MNNIFSYSPKELSTDAFLAWYVKELDKSDDGRKLAASFFYSLGLCKSPSDEIRDIRVSRQEKNTDLIISYEVNEKENVKALFENKIYTTTHSDQLERYASDFPDCQYYKYLKLGYVSFAERQQAEASGYEVIDVYQLKSALANSPSNMIVNQYKEFLDVQFIRVQDEIRNNLIKENKYELFERSEAQQYILSALHETLDQEIPDLYLYFKYAANSGGAPWTQLYIAKRDNAYGDKGEYLFWRIDRRKEGFYLRLNQYSYIDRSYWPKKQKNLLYLREFVSPLLEQHDLVSPPPSGRGIKESEVAIMYFAQNPLSKLTSLLPSLSKEISNYYSSCNEWE